MSNFCKLFEVIITITLSIAQELPDGTYDASPCSYIRNTVTNPKPRNCAVIGFYGWANDNWYNTPNWQMTDHSSIDFDVYTFYLWYDFQQIIFGWHNITDLVDMNHSYVTITHIQQQQSVRWSEDINVSFTTNAYSEFDAATIEVNSTQIYGLLITNIKMHIEWNYNSTDNDGVYPTYLQFFGVPRTFDPTMDPTMDPSFDPTHDPTADPTKDPTSDPTKDPTNDPTTDPTSEPTFFPTKDPTSDPTFFPTYHPTIDPTTDPTSEPTFFPTSDPTSDPTNDPTNDPTTNPTTDPTVEPTYDPTKDPTSDPTIDPTQHPTPPTMIPTNDPTFEPTSDPTVDPTSDPTYDPTVHPTSPTTHPTYDPTYDPTVDPTKDPTNDPTIDPTIDPTMDPTIDPTFDPTYDPTKDPTFDPTYDPTHMPTPPTASPTVAPSLAPTFSPSMSPTSHPTFSVVCNFTSNPIYECEFNVEDMAFCCSYLAANNHYINHYLNTINTSYEESKLSQTETLKLFAKVRNVQGFMLLIDCLLLIATAAIAIYLSVEELYDKENILAIVSMILSFGMFVDFLLTVSSLGIINESDLVGQMDQLTTYQCYNEEYHDKILKIQESFLAGILAFDGLGVALDIICLGILLYHIGYAKNNEWLKVSQTLLIIWFFVKCLCVCINLTCFALPSHQSLMQVYNNNDALCYHAKNGEDFDIEQHQSVVNGVGITFTILGISFFMFLLLKICIEASNGIDKNKQNNPHASAQPNPSNNAEEKHQKQLNNLHTWITDMNLENKYEDKIKKETKENKLTMDDIKSLRNAQDVGDAFEISTTEVNEQIFAGIKSIKGDDDRSDVSLTEENENNNGMFKINIFSQGKNMPLNQLVTKTDKVHKIKILYKAQSGMMAEIEEMKLYSKGKLLSPQDTLERAGIVDDRNLINVIFETGGVQGENVERDMYSH